MIQVNEILSKAVGLGACAKSGTATDWRSLCWLFFSPQGREFCREHNYPNIEMFREMKVNVEPYNVFVDERVVAHNESVAIIGESAAELHYSGTDMAYKVILMHGARAVIHASNYAVVRIENISGEYEVINDGTAKILL